MLNRLFRAALLALLVAGMLQVRADGERVRTRFHIFVPDDAFVFVARERMHSGGSTRIFESPPLLPGRRYIYEISVIYAGLEVSREVIFEAGRTVEIDFRPAFEKLLQRPTETPRYRRPVKPIRPEWLPRRVWRA